MDDNLSDSSSDEESPPTVKSSPSSRSNVNRPPRAPKSESLKQQSMPPPSSDIRVFPQNITFEGVKRGLLYSLTFSVQNKSKLTKRVRIIPPSTPNFDLIYTPVAGIASGMSVMGEIEFQLPSDHDSSKPSVFSDSITVKCETESITIPITALLPASDINFESLANLGFCVPEVPISKHGE